MFLEEWRLTTLETNEWQLATGTRLETFFSHTSRASAMRPETTSDPPKLKFVQKCHERRQ
jgi:hypothetical protein